MHDKPHSSREMADIESLFPIPSQTSTNDKLFLLGSIQLARSTNGYAYLEIGSLLGGSLTPFLMDPLCELVLSVDDRERVQPDERGISYDYTGITTQSMLDELNRCKIGTEKLRTFDGSIHELPDDYAASFDIALLDGEHTDEACFRDFIWTFPRMKSDAMIMFHDSTLIYKSIKLIMLYLDKAKVTYSFFKRANSEMSALFLGEYASKDVVQYFGAPEDRAAFFSGAEALMIKCQYESRARFRFAPSKLLKLKVPINVDIEAPRVEKLHF